MLAKHKLADAQAEQEAKAKAVKREATARENAKDLGCTLEEYKEHFGPMLSAGFDKGRLDVWYSDSSSTSVNTYGNHTQYVLHLVGRGQMVIEFTCMYMSIQINLGNINSKL